MDSLLAEDAVLLKYVQIEALGRPDDPAGGAPAGPGAGIPAEWMNGGR